MRIRHFIVLLGLLVAATPAAAQEKSTWAAIKERGSFRVGATQAEPWYFKDPRSNEWGGFSMHVARAIGKAMNVKVDVVETTWGNAIAALQANQIDLMFVLDATPERAMAVDFIMTPLLYYAMAVLHKDALKVELWEDLNKPGVNVATTLGTVMDTHVTTKLPKATINRFPNNDEVVASFQSGRSDVAVLFHPPLIALQKKVGMGKITLPKPVRASVSSVAVRREADTTWRDYLTHAVRYYYETGQLQAWYEEFLASRDINPKSVPPIMKELM
ncbi:MAG: transporter substrate-binding domain-containing protein [Alphaproteobacteria bacterium]|nr:transporter substrate-binding domain-containing protein [Alphaproteobacteria bacterium]